jgi:hypothetical protein
MDCPRNSVPGALIVNPQMMRRVRQWHFYMGVFFAPLIILFALSGALQTFRLQEEKGWGGTPPAWIDTIATVHMDSKLPQAAPVAAAPPKGPPKAAKPRPPGPNRLPMQIFMVVMSLALLLSAVLGVVIALNNRLTRRMSLVMLAGGTVLPLALLLSA